MGTDQELLQRITSRPDVFGGVDLASFNLVDNGTPTKEGLATRRPLTKGTRHGYHGNQTVQGGHCHAMPNIEFYHWTT